MTIKGFGMNNSSSSRHIEMAPPRSKESGRYVTAVSKALDILECFQTRPKLSLKELTKLTKMNRSRVMRLAGTLESRGFLSHNPDQKKYSLGSRLLTLGKVFEANNNLISQTRPILRRLAKSTGESAAIYAIDGLERITLACEKGTQGIQYNVDEGEHKELYAGAAGKVLLAFAPENVRSEIFKAKTFKRFTSHSIVDPQQLFNELHSIHRQGYAFSEGERIADAFAIAVPIFNHEHNCCAALGIAGPINRFPPEVRTRNLKIVQQEARNLSERLGAVLNEENNPGHAA